MMPFNLSFKKITNVAVYVLLVVSLFVLYSLLFKEVKLEEYKVVKVYDGDTFAISIPVNSDSLFDKEKIEKIRLIGIDAPEMNYEKGEPECFAEEATQFLKDLILNKKVELEYDAQKKDKYKRTLAYVYLQKNNKRIFVNEELVKAGFAVEKSYPPNTSKQEILKAAEEYARKNQLGLWQKCK